MSFGHYVNASSICFRWCIQKALKVNIDSFTFGAAQREMRVTDATLSQTTERSGYICITL